MSERKVLTKYYPPDFDPSQIQRVRGPKKTGPKVQTVRLMVPFSLKCLKCGEFIYRGRKFNARKETPPDEKYLGIQIFRFYIKCTRCSAEITFKTDPKNNDYACESGAKRNTEPWRVGREETDEERLDRLEREEEERNAMVELEAKTVDAKREMAVADALDEIRTRNARVERADRDGGGLEAGPLLPADADAERLEREDAEQARRAFRFARQVDAMVEVLDEEEEEDGFGGGDAPPAVASSSKADAEAMPPPPPPPKPETTSAAAAVVADVPPPPSFKRVVKKKKDHAAALGIKKKPSLV
ncbi:CWC16 protein [Biscogniauxia mediterranea]|nr:CWC16 protein [Biscogniauxia mediterranea]